MTELAEGAAFQSLLDPKQVLQISKGANKRVKDLHAWNCDSDGF
jgi:hypothetical protein